MTEHDEPSASSTGEAGPLGIRDPDAPPEPHPVARADHDDLEGFETSMSKLADRMKGWMAALLAVALIVPFSGWLIDEVLFRRGASDVEASAAAAVVDAVYLVRTIGCAGEVRTGSAFLVDVGDGPIVVTNRHVVEDARSVGLRSLRGSTSLRAIDVRISDAADVAVLSLPEDVTAPPPLRLADPPQTGDAVRVVGFPAALPYTTAGAVSLVSAGQVLLDLEVDPGASGSPVVDADGEVVAQVFARTDAGTGVATSSALLGRAIVQARPDPGC